MMSTTTTTTSTTPFHQQEEKCVFAQNLVAPKPVKPRRRQRSIMSLDTFLKDPNTSTGTSSESPSTTSPTVDSSVDEIFQIMKQTNFMTNENCAWDAGDAFPSSPVVRHSRNPIILNSSFQEMAN